MKHSPLLVSAFSILMLVAPASAFADALPGGCGGHSHRVIQDQDAGRSDRDAGVADAFVTGPLSLGLTANLILRLFQRRRRKDQL